MAYNHLLIFDYDKQITVLNMDSSGQLQTFTDNQYHLQYYSSFYQLSTGVKIILTTNQMGIVVWIFDEQQRIYSLQGYIQDSIVQNEGDDLTKDSFSDYSFNILFYFKNSKRNSIDSSYTDKMSIKSYSQTNVIGYYTWYKQEESSILFISSFSYITTFDYNTLQKRYYLTIKMILHQQRQFKSQEARKAQQYQQLIAGVADIGVNILITSDNKFQLNPNFLNIDFNNIISLNLKSAQKGNFAVLQYKDILELQNYNFIGFQDIKIEFYQSFNTSSYGINFQNIKQGVLINNIKLQNTNQSLQYINCSSIYALSAELTIQNYSIENEDFTNHQSELLKSEYSKYLIHRWTNIKYPRYLVKLFHQGRLINCSIYQYILNRQQKQLHNFKTILSLQKQLRQAVVYFDSTSNSQISITNCSISNFAMIQNQATLLFQSYNSTLIISNTTVTNCQFITNVMYLLEGQININQTYFLNLTKIMSKRYLSGQIEAKASINTFSLIYAKETNIINNSKFSQITCGDCSGGALQILNGIINIQNSIFDQIYVINYIFFKFVSIFIFFKKSQFGGALFIYRLQGKNQISNTVLKNCQSYQDGGSMFLWFSQQDEFDLNMNQCLLQNNTSQKGKRGGEGLLWLLQISLILKNQALI
ncbi:hypothetical protein ABPG72_000749 [Tetrahymena utriculariae]